LATTTAPSTSSPFPAASPPPGSPRWSDDWPLPRLHPHPLLSLPLRHRRACPGGAMIGHYHGSTHALAPSGRRRPGAAGSGETRGQVQRPPSSQSSPHGGEPRGGVDSPTPADSVAPAGPVPRFSAPSLRWTLREAFSPPPGLSRWSDDWPLPRRHPRPRPFRPPPAGGGRKGKNVGGNSAPA